MEFHSYTDPVYTMAVAAEQLNIHPQTLRFYEREGLISPSRTEFGQRMYSKKDLNDVQEIRILTREKGVNLAGVKIILEMRDEMRELKRLVEARSEKP